MSLDFSKLENVREQNGKTIARCPVCKVRDDDEKGEHLFIAKDGGYGCVIGCDDKEIFALAGEAPGRRNGHGNVKAQKCDPPQGESKPPISREVSAYSYQDAHGAELYQAIRYEPKSFRQCRMVDGNRVWKMDGVTRVPYRLPELLKAETIWLCEGEKDADNLAAISIAATCRAGGSSKWDDELTPWFAGKEVVLCGDNDEPGRAYMVKVEAALRGTAKCIRRITVPAPHKDISDYLGDKSQHEAGSAILELLANAEDAAAQDPYRCVDWLDFSAEQAKEPEPVELIEGLLHRGSKLVLGGSSKSNKTWSLLDMAISVASGSTWWGKATTAGPVVYVDMELSKKQLFKRVQKLLEARGITLARGQLHLINLRGHVTNAAQTVERIRKASPAGIALIIIDPIYKFNAGRDENSAGQIGEMLNTLESLAVETGAAVAYAAHYSKGNQAAKEAIDRISGSGVYARDADTLVMMTKHEEDECFTIETTVRNFVRVEPFAVRWQYPLMVRDGSLDPAKLKKVPGAFEAKYSVGQLVEMLGTQTMTFGQIEHASKEHFGMSKPTVNRLLKQGIEAGSIEKSNLLYRSITVSRQ